ncbi:MAG: tetratricopeptide repeat protein [Candidatus Omnitrophica bacterium]|nr:tetratricopeptide repeat protein [Candidatus Omnitrophota bacterium]MDD5488235.1 tetratricopeptide repeat protein [Candidatus Omnitrophota bacterium]
MSNFTGRYTCIFLIICAFLATGPKVAHSSDNTATAGRQDEVTLLAENIYHSSLLVKEGSRCYDNGDVATARMKFEEALAKDPENSEARRFLDMIGPADTSVTPDVESPSGISSSGTDVTFPASAPENVQASDDAVKELAQKIFAAKILVKKGKIFLDNGDTDNASAKFSEALENDPENMDARKYLALCSADLAPRDGNTGAPDITDKSVEPVIRPVSASQQNEINLLEQLEARVKKLESGQKSETPGTTTAAASATPPATINPAPKSLTGDTKVRESARLIEQGDKYYDRGEYKKAYSMYKKALENLD